MITYNFNLAFLSFNNTVIRFLQVFCVDEKMRNIQTLLILLLVVGVNCDGRSLAFVIDSTGSMSAEISQVKFPLYIFDTHFGNNI